MIDQELVRKARQTDLVAYLMNRGEPLKRVGANYIHREHDSLYIKGNMFVWYSQDKKGNSIDFLMLYYGMSFKESVEALVGANLKEVTYTPPQSHIEAPQRANRSPLL